MQYAFGVDPRNGDDLISLQEYVTILDIFIELVKERSAVHLCHGSVSDITAYYTQMIPQKS